MDTMTQEPIHADWQKSGKPSNLSNDVLQFVNYTERAYESKEIGGTLVDSGVQTLQKLVPLVQTRTNHVSDELERHFYTWARDDRPWNPEDLTEPALKPFRYPPACFLQKCNDRSD